METEKLLKALEAVEAIIRLAVETKEPTLVRWDKVLDSVQRVLAAYSAEEAKNDISMVT